MRSWWRHEQQSIRMALGAAAHHSAQQYAALRGPKTGTRAREGEVPEKYDAPRRQNAPHPGERPGILAEPGPQRSDRSLRRSAGDSLPQLVAPSLAGAAGEGVDSATLAFLLSQSLAAKEKEEQVKREEEAKETLKAWKQRRKKVKDEFMALMDLPTLSPHDEVKLRELVLVMEVMDASRPGSSSTSSSCRKKKKKRRKRRRRLTMRSWSTRRLVRCLRVA